MEFSDVAAIIIEYLIQEIPNEKDILYELDQVIKEIKDSPEKIIRCLSASKEDLASSNNLCPICNAEIIVTNIDSGEVLEYNGFPVKRKEVIIQCSECGEVF